MVEILKLASPFLSLPREVKHQMPNFELQLVERLAGMEKLLKTQPSPSQPVHHLGEQIVVVFLYTTPEDFSSGST
jgi:hypothetical protein